ncbi:hypothetical protein FJQ54_14485 [Sandaracinobacter neustonicus]|uniref:Uncharacterized protein n=1 Tax=Sandaracinobacter neustonicus TaxID=1715348 RepID=A0A501XFA0_9SPHN|nr:hypothetical protein [Sandaracinobacter neustonicus]TPE59007.1 hypothetical protein FJQ54_14485 [Sandaracinobacter neustonicus]
MIEPISATPRPQPSAETKEAAKAFEAMMLRQLLQPVLPNDGAAPLALDTLAKQLAETAPFGFARLIGDSK